MSEVNWPHGLSVHSLFSVVQRTIASRSRFCDLHSIGRCETVPLVAITRPDPETMP